MCTLLSCTKIFTLGNFCVMLKEAELNHNLLERYLLHTHHLCLLSTSFSYSMSSDKTRNPWTVILPLIGMHQAYWCTFTAVHQAYWSSPPVCYTTAPHHIDCYMLYRLKTIQHIGKKYLDSATKQSYPEHFGPLCVTSSQVYHQQDNT